MQSPNYFRRVVQSCLIEPWATGNPLHVRHRTTKSSSDMLFMASALGNELNRARAAQFACPADFVGVR